MRRDKQKTTSRDMRWYRFLAGVSILAGVLFLAVGVPDAVSGRPRGVTPAEIGLFPLFGAWRVWGRGQRGPRP
jgi:hypothetical protein